MSSTKKPLSDEKIKSSSNLYHLVDASSHGKPICGAAAQNVKTGAYVEHLVTRDNCVEWVREILDENRQPVSEACGICLTVYPSALIKVNPFDVCINLHFEENKSLRNSYRVTASGVATIGNIRKEISISQAIISFTARWIGDLRFPVHVDLASIVPWIEQANKQQTKNKD